MTRGMRGFIVLKRQFKLIDCEGKGSLSLNDFLQAFDDLKITNLQSGELKMIFEIYDNLKKNLIDYHKFLSDLIQELPAQRLRLVNEAFNHLDINNNGVLELSEVKAKFEPLRHPDVLSRVKTVEEARFEFHSLFTSLHSANKGFKDEQVVTLEDFIEYHAIVNTQIERDIEFRNFIIGVWNMDV